jgi:hypothetical protein
MQTSNMRVENQRIPSTMMMMITTAIMQMMIDNLLRKPNKKINLKHNHKLSKIKFHS